jgi:hypothetical protein
MFVASGVLIVGSLMSRPRIPLILGLAVIAGLAGIVIATLTLLGRDGVVKQSAYFIGAGALLTYLALDQRRSVRS